MAVGGGKHPSAEGTQAGKSAYSNLRHNRVESGEILSFPTLLQYNKHIETTNRNMTSNTEVVTISRSEYEEMQGKI